jgi:hypothetical protein
MSGKAKPAPITDRCAEIVRRWREFNGGGALTTKEIIKHLLAPRGGDE